MQRCTLTLTALQGDVLYQPGPRDPDRGAAIWALPSPPVTPPTMFDWLSRSPSDQ